jgi:hypothetical protein
MSILMPAVPLRQLSAGVRPADLLLVAAVASAAACGGGWYVLLAVPALAGVVLRIRLRRVPPCSGERARTAAAAGRNRTALDHGGDAAHPAVDATSGEIHPAGEEGAAGEVGAARRVGAAGGPVGAVGAPAGLVADAALGQLAAVPAGG